MNAIVKVLAAAAAASALSAAHAAPIVLDFEGIPNGSAVGNFYASNGVQFSPATLVVVDSDAGGSGNIANEPSPNTVMFFLDANNAILNYAAGFTTGFSFFYTSSTAAIVTVYDDVGGKGNILGSLNLAAQHNLDCTGDPTGSFCNWSAIGIAFDGIAKSIDFGGTANQTAFDDVTIGASTPGNVPEPATLALAGLALAGAGIARRRKA